MMSRTQDPSQQQIESICAVERERDRTTVGCSRELRQLMTAAINNVRRVFRSVCPAGEGGSQSSLILVGGNVNRFGFGKAGGCVVEIDGGRGHVVPRTA